jgi:hypothetical protein
MKIYQPYTYLLGWKHLNKFYYGVRYSKNCYVGDVMIKYFTSSNIVKKMLRTYGKPDIIQVRKVFNTREKAILWESKVLRRINAAKRSDFVNCHHCISAPIMFGLMNPSKRPEVREKLSQIAKNRPKHDAIILKKMSNTKKLSGLIKFLKNRKKFQPNKSTYLVEKITNYIVLVEQRSKTYSLILKFLHECLTRCQTFKKTPYPQKRKRGPRGPVPAISKAKQGKKWYCNRKTLESKPFYPGEQPEGWELGLIKNTPNNNTPEVRKKISDTQKNYRASETYEKKRERLKKYHDTIKNRKSKKNQ